VIDQIVVTLRSGQVRFNDLEKRLQKESVSSMERCQKEVRTLISCITAVATPPRRAISYALFAVV